jgi:Antitoxin FitA-like, ribbon-helix-helix
MKYLLIQDIDPEFYRRLEERAHLNGRSLAEEVEWLMREGLASPNSKIRMGTWMFNLVPPEYRSDDLVFEYDGPESPPPDFD